MPNRFPSAARRVLVLAAVAVTAASCTGANIVKDYGPEARANFVDGCTTLRKVVDHKVLEKALAPRSTCECVYTAMKDEFRLPWGDVADYEKEVAAAPAGQAPAMPPKMQKSVDKCTTAGPSAPSSTTTTAKPG